MVVGIRLCYSSPFMSCLTSPQVALIIFYLCTSVNKRLSYNTVQSNMRKYSAHISVFMY